MKTSIAAVVGAALLLAASAANANITYSVSFVDGLNETLTGSITTDGKTVGSLSVSDIRAWTFTEANWAAGSGGVNSTISSTDLGATLLPVSDDGSLNLNWIASKTTLQFTASASPVTWVRFFDGANAQVGFQSYNSNVTGAAVGWASPLGASSVVADVNSPYTIGTAAPVPLPASAWLLGSGMLGLVGLTRRRKAA